MPETVPALEIGNFLALMELLDFLGENVPPTLPTTTTKKTIDWVKILQCI